MDAEDWQVSRIRNSRYLQDGVVKPWPWGFQVQILGAEGIGRHKLLSRVGPLPSLSLCCFVSTCHGVSFFLLLHIGRKSERQNKLIS